MENKVPTLHQLVASGDVAGVRAHIRCPDAGKLVNAYDDFGYTPLMQAVRSERADPAMVRELLDAGARIDLLGPAGSPSARGVLSMAVASGDAVKVKMLLDTGADVRYRGAHGSDALIDAAHGQDVLGSSGLLDLLRLLVDAGTALNGVSEMGGSALKTFAWLGRFDAVALLLAAGADRAPLGWAPVHEAVALGSLADVERCVRTGARLDDRDTCSRTPWVLAVQLGDRDKAELLARHGADTGAAACRGTDLLRHAVDSQQPQLVTRLLELGYDVETVDSLGETPLTVAASWGNVEVLRILLAHGADVDRESTGGTALRQARSEAVVRLLLDAGADPEQLSTEGRRVLLGFSPDSDVSALRAVPLEAFATARLRRFGRSNPEATREPFWEAMIRAGVSAYQAEKWFVDLPPAHPVWCAQRFGQSFTLLPDGRVVQIGGEHEDWYDNDFCIYNDVFVHHPDGSITIFGYPPSDFPPTDFHSATVCGEHIYVIGSLGYLGERVYGHTPVFRLDTRDFRFERVATTGDMPGWINRHRARSISATEVHVSGGNVLTRSNGKEVTIDNMHKYVLDVQYSVWRRA